MIRPSALITVLKPSYPSRERENQLLFQIKTRRNPQALWKRCRAVIRAVKTVPEREIGSEVAVRAIAAVVPHVLVRGDQQKTRDPVKQRTRPPCEGCVSPQIQTGRDRGG